MPELGSLVLRLFGLFGLNPIDVAVMLSADYSMTRGTSGVAIEARDLVLPLIGLTCGLLIEVVGLVADRLVVP